MHKINYNLALPFYENMLAQPERVALFVQGAEYSYGELGLLASKIAGWLTTHIDGKSYGRIGVLSSRSKETYLGILGAAWAGYTYVPLSSKLPDERLRKLLLRAGLDALIVDPSAVTRLRHFQDCAPRLIVAPSSEAAPDFPGRVSAGKPEIAASNILAQPRLIDPESIAYIIFTSGSTGEPKGVMVKALGVYHLIDFMQGIYKITADDRVSQFSDTMFDQSVFDIFMAWRGGASLNSVSDEQRAIPIKFIQDRKLTVWQAVPSIIAILRELNVLAPNVFPTLRVSIFGGEPLLIQAARAWQEAAPNSTVDNHYGPTETTVDSHMERLSQQPSLTVERGTLAIGRPLGSVQSAIVDDQLNFQAQGTMGELVISGPQVSAGYLDDEEKTKKHFVVLRHPIHGESTWYLTGDLGYEDQSGRFHLLGRKDNQIKLRGQRIELDEIEAHMRQICGTDQVAVIAWPIEDGAPSGIAAFVAKSKIVLSEIVPALAKQVPSYMVPARIELLDSLPLNQSNKIDRRALFARLDRQAGSQSVGDKRGNKAA